jgi:enoyl-CoA hydratase
MCDIILASPTAKFGQPEIKLGVIPGGGGSQRLTRIIGKSRTMELVLTGRNISAQEAEKWGMVSRVVGDGEGEVVKEAVAMAKDIAGYGQIAVQAGKEAVNAGSSLHAQFLALAMIDLYLSLRIELGRGFAIREKIVPQSVCDERSERG